MKRRKLLLPALLALVMVVVLFTTEFGSLLIPGAAASAPVQAEQLSAKKGKSTQTPRPTKTPRPTSSPTPAPDGRPTVSPVPDGPIIDPQTIADFIFANGCLPPNFITKAEAQRMGWDSRSNYVSDVAPGMSIGGDRFGNYEGLLPTAKGRQYYEADCYYVSGKRNAYRVIFSNDGLVFYTEDHYQTFIQLYPSDICTLAPSPTPAPTPTRRSWW